MTRTDETQHHPAPESHRTGGMIVRERRRSSPIRVDIQALRALAVSLVLVYHLSATALPGGYVGVDVFFVISGFLITAHLLREMESTGSVRLRRFWARRARRLLPAALVVLVVTAIATWLLAPVARVPNFLTHIAASAGYVQNWLLASESVDYLANVGLSSPVQHYWSLSVEEQFYILWPVIALGAVWIATRLRSASVRRVFTRVIIGVIAGSLLASILMTELAPARAYFDSTVRAWEFAAGGVCAMTSTGLRRLPRGARVALVWAGIAAIVVSALTFTDATPFPGAWALMPVLGTVAVILAWEPGGPFSPLRVFRLPQVQWLGDVSYGVYLWHFPLIAFVPLALGLQPARFGPSGGLVYAAAITGATLFLAWATKVLVEDPMRRGPARAWTNRRTFAAVAGAMAIVIAVSLTGAHVGTDRLSLEQQRVQAQMIRGGECLGAKSRAPGSACVPAEQAASIPDLSLAGEAPERCLSEQKGDDLDPCEYGVDASEAKRTVALVGDSHAEQWLMALDRIAAREEWHVIVMSKASCPFTAGERDYVSLSEPMNEEFRENCATWNERVLERLDRDPGIDTVITSAKSTNQVVTANGETSLDRARTDYVKRWEQLPDSVEHVIAIRDTPQLPDDVVTCMAEEPTSASDCRVPRTDAFDADPLAEATAVATSTPEVTSDVSLVDLSEYFVVDDSVPAAIGGVLAFRDSHHMSWAYALTLADPLEAELDRVLEAGVD